MPLGIPVPENLAAMSLDELHKLHAQFWSERAELKEKHASIMPMIWAKEAQRQAAARAGFDTVLVMPQSAKKFTLAKAKQIVADAAEGFYGLPGDMLDRLKRIIASGKDEE